VFSSMHLSWCRG